MQRDIEVYRDVAAVHRSAAEDFVRRSRDAVADRGHFCVALSGGATPLGLYALLATEPYVSAVAWGKTHVFWGDERHVAPEHPDSNFGAARTALLDKVPVSGDRVHRVPTELAPAAAAEHYTATLRQVIGERGFDLVLLGMGADGHTASLFPGSDALGAGGRGAVACQADATGAPRVSLTLPEINRADAVVVLVADPAKAEALAGVRAGSTALPAALVRPEHGAVRWLLDRPTADAVRARGTASAAAAESTAGAGTVENAASAAAAESMAGAAGAGATKSAASDATNDTVPGSPLPDLEQLKAVAGRRAARMVSSGMRVGLGTGSTARHVVLGIAERLDRGELDDVIGVPTSRATEALARDVGVPLTSLERQPRLDLTIDGADEVAPNIDLVKGLGGALLREKIVAAASDRMVVVADETKLVDRLGTKAPLPVAVAPFAWQVHIGPLRDLGAEPVLRVAADGSPVVTDDGLFLLDCGFEDGIAEPELVERAVRARPGVVDSGLFLNMADTALIADRAGVMIYHR